MKTKEILIAVAIIATRGFVSAQDNKTETAESKKSCYVDANNNNLCDNYEDKSCTTGDGKGLQDGSGQGKGLRDGSGRRNGQGNGQGLHNGTGHRNGKGLNDGTGRRNGKGNRHVANFVDANKNGVCDHSETVKK